MPEVAKPENNPTKRKGAGKVLQPVSPTQAAAGHNSGFDAKTLFLYYMAQIDASDQKVKDASDARKKLRSAAEQDGVNLEFMDMLRRERKKDDKTVSTRWATFVTYANYMGLPVGTQTELFNSGGSEGRAKDAGYRDGVGAKTFDKAYDTSSIIGQAYLEGYNAGQDVNKQLLLRHNKEYQEQQAAQKAAAAQKKAEADNNDQAGSEDAPAEQSEETAGEPAGEPAPAES